MGIPLCPLLESFSRIHVLSAGLLYCEFPKIRRPILDPKMVGILLQGHLRNRPKKSRNSDI